MDSLSPSTGARSVAQKHNHQKTLARLLLGTAVAGLASGLSVPANAQACGVSDQGTVSCTPADNPYTFGIAYSTPAVNPPADPFIDPTVEVYDLTVNLDAATTVETAPGIAGISLSGANNGSVTLNAADDTSVSVTGAGISAVSADTMNGDITLNTDSVVAQGASVRGISATSDVGNISVVANSVDVTGNAATGIVAGSDEGDVNVNAGTVTAQGAGSTGIVAASGSGTVSVTADEVSASGANAGAIVAAAGGSSVNVSVGQASTDGDGAIAIIATGDDVTVSADNVETSGAGAYGVLAFSNASTVAADSIATQGDGAIGAIVASGAGDSTFTSSGTISTVGNGAIGVYGISGNGNTDISVNSVSTQGANALGVFAVANAGTASVTAGDIDTTGDNAVAIGVNGGNSEVTINGNVTTSGFQAYGVAATGSTGTVDITNNGSISTTGDNAIGINAEAEGDLTVSGSGTVATTGEAATGIYAQSNGGAVAISTGNVTTAGDGAQGIYASSEAFAPDTGISINAASITTAGSSADAIYAESLVGDITTNATGSISTAGENSFGVYASTIAGDATVTVNNVTTVGDDSVGIQAIGYNANVTVNGDVSTSGTTGTFGSGSDGVIAIGQVDMANVVINGSVSTTGVGSTGVLAEAAGNAMVTNAGRVTTAGDFADAINASSDTGSVFVVNNGAVTTSGENSLAIAADAFDQASVTSNGSIRTTSVDATGIYASGGTAAVVNAASVSTTGDGADAIFAVSNGDVSVNAGTISTAGEGSDGIFALSYGSNTSVIANNVAATGVGSSAIFAGALNGDASVRVTGAVSSAQDTAVLVAADGDASVRVSRTGSVTGAIDSISTLATGTTTIVNAGTINTGSGYAILVGGGPAAVTNSGVINGRVQLSAGDDTFTNSGRFNVSASSDFGAGNDTFTNSGTVLINDAGTAPVNVAFTGLEQFNNSGRVDLRNGTAGDSFTIPGTFTGSGNSTLALDVGANAQGIVVADRLNVGTATGSTLVQINPIGPIYTTSGVTIVDAATASSSTAFRLSPDQAEVGFVALDLVYRPATSEYQLVGTPGSAAYRATKAIEGAQNLWYRSADIITAHVTSVRDGRWSNKANAGGLWFEMSGGVNNRDETATVNQFGVTRSYNLDYQQDYFGGQLGFDVGTMGENGGVVFGVTGGYLSSKMRFDEGTRFGYDAVNVGGYLSLQAGGFFVNALGKYDHYWVDANARTVGYRDKFKGDAIGAQGEVGFRLGSSGFFAEPLASIAYVRTKLGDLRAFGQVIDFDRAEGLRGKAGLRIGGTTSIGAGNVLTFYASGMAVKEFEGKDGATFISGPNTFDLRNQRIGTYGQGTVGVNITTPSGIVGFMEANVDASKSYNGAGGRAGLKIPF